MKPNRVFAISIKAIFGLGFALALLTFSVPPLAHAQSSETTLLSRLTPANGWQEVSKEGFSVTYKNTDPNSSYYNSTATCNFSAGGAVMQSTDISCSVTRPDGSTETEEQNIGAGTRVTTDASKDADGKLTSIGQSVDGANGSCSLVNPGEWGNCIVKAVAGAILTLANFLLATAGTLLNWVVVKTVFQFGSLIGNSPGMLVAWGILRDIGNMLLLFGFIFMGLATILNLQTFAVRKALPPLIIVAILMNFSLFAAEAVIDTSNALTTALYRQTNTTPCTGVLDGGTVTANDTTEIDTSCAVSYGIAGHIMQSTGLSSLFATSNAGFGQSVTVYLMLSLFATIGAVVLFATSIMLIIRVVVLSFIMVAAPIGFIGMAIPPMRRFASDWWRRLISQSFFAPVLFLLIFISLKITDSFTGVGDKTGLANQSLAGALMQPGSSTMGVVLVFTLVIGFLIASLVAAKSMGATGASVAVNGATRLVYGATTRGTNFMVGGSADRLRYLQQKYAPNSRVGKFANKRILTPLTSANLDMRRLPGVGKALSTAGAGDAAKPAEHATYADIRHQYQDFRSNKRGKERETAYRGRLADQNFEEAVHDAEAHDTDLQPDSKKYLNKLTTKQLEELHGIKEGVGVLARNLSPEQFENLMKSDKLSETEKEQLREGRYGHVKDMATTATTSGTPADSAKLKAALGGMSKKELENMPASVLLQDIVLNNLTDKQREDLGGSDKLSTSARAQVKQSNLVEKIKSDFQNVGAAGIIAGSGTSGIKYSDLTREQVAKLPKDVLTSRQIAQQFTPNVLMALQEEKGKFTPSDIQTIANHIKALGSGPAYDYVSGKDSPGKIFWS